MDSNASILITIEGMLGDKEAIKPFETQLIPLINGNLIQLTDIVPGLDKPFSISGDGETWNDFFGSRTDLEDIKTYIYIKTKLVFDPPQSSFVLESLKEILKETEFRLSIRQEEGDTSDSK